MSALGECESSGTEEGSVDCRGGTARGTQERVWCEVGVVVQMWAHRRDVSAPLRSPDVHGECAHVNCVGVICVASQLRAQTCNPTSSPAGAKL